MRGFRSIISHVILNVNCRIPVGRPVSPARIPRPSMYASVVTARQRMRRSHCHTSGIAGITHGCPGSGRHGHTAQFSWCARRDSNPHDVTHCHLKAARLPIPPRALGRSARDLSPDRINGADVTNRGWRDKARRRGGSGGSRIRTGLAAARHPRQHLLDFDRNTVAIDKHHAAGDRQVVGEDLDLVRFSGLQLDDGATAQPHYLMDGHGCGPEDHHQIDADFIEGWHWKRPELTLAKLPGSRSPRYG